MYRPNYEINNNLKEASILVVDDEPANIRLVEKMLAMTGYRNVISTVDSTQVLSLYQEHNSDLILLDLDMPKLDGFAVLDKLGGLKNVILPPILVLSAMHMQSFRQRALDNGARDYVTKPFDADELLSRVRNLLEVQLANKYMLHQNEILEQKVRERTQAINLSRLQVVRRLGRAAEYRDNETGLHIIRMSKIAVVIGRAAGLNEEQCDLLLHAAPMHDIGKLGIPDHILLKPGKLDADEWTIMQTHSQIGADILFGDESDLLSMAHDIALAHHEKWNGKGYPNGLSGEDIPLVGRITAVADVFDALTSERPYKKAWTITRAVDLIKAESGQHFDPALVKCFVDNLSTITKIKEEHMEPIRTCKNDNARCG